MDDWIQIISNQWYRTISTREIKLVCYELNVLSIEHINLSHVNLNKVSSHGKIIMDAANMSSEILRTLTHIQIKSIVNKVCSRSMKKKRLWQVLLIFESIYLKYIKSLQSERKSELSISNKMWQHVFRSGKDLTLWIKCIIKGIYYAFTRKPEYGWLAW